MNKYKFLLSMLSSWNPAVKGLQNSEIILAVPKICHTDLGFFPCICQRMTKHKYYRKHGNVSALKNGCGKRPPTD